MSPATLFANRVTADGSFDVVRLTGAWSELTLTAGIAPAEGATEQSAVAVGLVDKDAFKAVDITAVVKDWIDGTLTNDGLVLAANASNGLNAKFDSKENGGKSHPPQLEVTLGATSATIVDGSVGNADLAPNAVTSANIVNGTVANADLATNAVTSTNIVDASVANADLAADAVTSDKILDETITGADVFDGSLRNVDIDFGDNDNTGVGESSLPFAATGFSNTAVGASVLGTNTSGYSNTAVGHSALGSNMGGHSNTALGEKALSASTSVSGSTAVGTWALEMNTSGTGNTAVGGGALATNAIGSNNVAVGYLALGVSTASNSSALGFQALDANTTGASNTAVGSNALGANTTASNNSALGIQALDANTIGASNTAVGSNALGANTTGDGNVALGFFAGASWTTGDNNIAIGTSVFGTGGESNTIRIGSGQTATYIAGVYSPVATTRAVFVDSTGKLGTTLSSRQFKTGIRSIGDASSALLKLRPVSFRYKKSVSTDQTLQYGLIAEEVAKVFPELVEFDAQGKPQTVRYHFLSALLLNELQKQYRTQQTLQVDVDRQERRLEQQAQFIATMRTENAALRAQVDEINTVKARLEALEAGGRAVAGR